MVRILWLCTGDNCYRNYEKTREVPSVTVLGLLIGGGGDCDIIHFFNADNGNNYN